MEIVNKFVIEAPYGEVWDMLLDIERVASCMPGAQIDNRVDDTTHEGRFRVKVGPVSAAYRGQIQIVASDSDKGIVVMRGSGSDSTGAGTAAATITSSVAESGAGTEVSMATELELTGRIAQFGGRGSMMQSIADRMISEFASSLQREMQRASSTEAAVPPPASPSLDDASLQGSASDPAQTPDAFNAGGLLLDVLGQGLPLVACLGLVFVCGVAVGRWTAGRR
jgi:carbon monoxide dehydrogenase subunit G